MTDADDWTRLARYFAGECTAEEAEVTRRWIEEDPERQRLAEETRAAWHAAETPSVDPAEWDTPAAWQRLSARARARERSVTERSHLGVVRPHRSVAATRRWRAPALAAAAVIVAVAGAMLWRRLSEPATSVVATQPLREVRTVAGQRAVLTLGDGSRVVLAPSSVLRYDSTRFGVSSRELELEGEAHFTVAHMTDVSAPAFLVKTDRGVVRDIGTAFNVRAFQSEHALQVVVSAGSVMLRERTLKRGDLARVDSAGVLDVRRGVNVDRYMAWTEGRLVFDDTPLREVIPELERWYDLDITITDASLGDRRFVATLREGAATSALELLAISLNLRIERHGRAVTLSPRPPTS
jgi:ferric-dicitrate binding protein FerR (iron transport regulator)